MACTKSHRFLVHLTVWSAGRMNPRPWMNYEEVVFRTGQFEATFDLLSHKLLCRPSTNCCLKRSA